MPRLYYPLVDCSCFASPFWRGNGTDIIDARCEGYLSPLRLFWLQAAVMESKDDFTFAKLSDINLPVTFRMCVSIIQYEPYRIIRVTALSWKARAAHRRTRSCSRSLS
jgi:hypothetical protein